MSLNRNVTHAEIEQAAFEPNNMVPGPGLSPGNRLLARFSYADAHRARPDARRAAGVLQSVELRPGAQAPYRVIQFPVNPNKPWSTG